MARIKYVLNERRLAYEGAIKLVEAEAEEVSALKEDEKVLKHQLQEWRKGRSLRKAARRQSRRAPDSLVSAPVEDATTTLPSEISIVTSAETSAPTTEPTVEAEAPSSVLSETPVQQPDAVDAKVEDSPAILSTEKAKTRSERRAERRKKETEELLAKEAPEGIDAVESSLFGGPSSGKNRS